MPSAMSSARSSCSRLLDALDELRREPQPVDDVLLELGRQLDAGVLEGEHGVHHQQPRQVGLAVEPPADDANVLAEVAVRLDADRIAAAGVVLHGRLPGRRRRPRPPLGCR